MTTPAENQNWQKRQYDSFGPHFRIETANPELGTAGNIAYNLYGYSDSKDVSNLGMMGDGQFQIFADQCITIAGGANVNIQKPIDFVFYAASASTVTSTTQYLPLFVANVEAVPDDQSFSLTEKLILPFINSPVVHAGSNFGSANSTIAPKMRGLILPRGVGLFVGISGVGSLTNGFYVNVQGGYY